MRSPTTSANWRRAGRCGRLTFPFFPIAANARDRYNLPMPKNYWLVKQEPEAYSWATFVKEGRTPWTGVRNFTARNNLRAMKKGDLVLFYHSVAGKEVVGIAKVAREAYPDATADAPGWDCVDLAPVKPLKSRRH